MKKVMPILILLIIVAVVSVSGCISTIDTTDDNPVDSIIENIQNNNASGQKTVENTVIDNINKSGNIIISTEKESDTIKNKYNNQNSNTKNLKYSKEEIENKIVEIFKSENPELNFSANAVLKTGQDGITYYVVDVYDNYGWFGVFEINANTGITGNSVEGYSFDGGAVRGETGEEATPINGIMPNLSINDAKKIIDENLKNNYSIYNATYSISGFVENNTPYYNISIEENIGSAIMNANTGEIISILLKDSKDINDNSNNSQKIYSINEAGDFVDIIYKGEKVSVRENYPYYSPQNDKVYYSAEQEAEDLYQLAQDLK